LWAALLSLFFAPDGFQYAGELTVNWIYVKYFHTLVAI